jgi:nucleotide-binding universal stress UspA family protein
MNRILVYTPAEDHRGRAVALAASLARKTGASLTLVRVIEENATWPRGADAAQLEDRLRDLMVDSETRALEEIAESLGASSTEPLEIDIDVRWGVPWEVVIDLVERDRFDLVIKPARGLSHSGRVFFGATALHLFRRCPCPVWVVGDDGNLPQRILISIDPSLDQTRRQMASKLLEWGDVLRVASGAEIEVASAWQAPGADALKEKLEASEFDAYVRDALQRAESGLETILKERVSAPAHTRCHLLAGPARDVIPEFTEDRGFDLVLVGTLGRTGLVGEILGETAEMILRGVRCSVLAISPRHRAPHERRD